MARTIQILSLCESMDWTSFGLEWTKYKCPNSP
nr:MAG TPA: hypothetical protein [Caudoviricetes sp.]